MGEGKGDTFSHFHFPLSFPFPFFTRLVTVALQNFEYNWDVQNNMFLLLCLLNVFQVLFKINQLFKNTTQKSALIQDNYEWEGVWEAIGRHLEEWVPPML